MLYVYRINTWHICVVHPSSPRSLIVCGNAHSSCAFSSASSFRHSNCHKASLTEHTAYEAWLIANHPVVNTRPLKSPGEINSNTLHYCGMAASEALAQFGVLLKRISIRSRFVRTVTFSRMQRKQRKNLN